MLIVPPGCAHGYVTLEDRSDVAYWISAPYRPSARRAASASTTPGSRSTGPCSRPSSPPATAPSRRSADARSSSPAARASSAARSCRRSSPPATRCWRRPAPRPTCWHPASPRAWRPERCRGRAGAPGLGGGARLRHLRRPTPPGCPRASSSPPPSPTPAAAGSWRPAAAPSSTSSARRRTPTRSARCTSGCARWPSRAGSSWPGRACSSCTGPASTRSGWSRRSPPASRPGREALASTGRQRRDYLDVRDAGAALAAARDEPRHRPVRRRQRLRPGRRRHRPHARRGRRPARPAAARRAAVAGRGAADRGRPVHAARRHRLGAADHARRRAARGRGDRRPAPGRLPLIAAEGALSCAARLAPHRRRAPRRRRPPPARTARRTAAGRRRSASSSSSCVPCSTIRPCSITRIRSASRIVDSRWAITKLVRFSRSAAIARCTSTSVRVSTELVASSRISSDGVGQERPRDRDQLLLAGADARALVVDHGVVAVGQAVHEAVDERRLGGREDLLVGGVGAAVADVVADRARRTARRPAAPCRSRRAGRRGASCAMSTPSSVMRPPSSS